MPLPLTRQQRAALFDGQCPAITGEGPCPAEPGKTYALTTRFAVKVLAVRRRRQGGWALHYEVHDRRDTPRLLRRTPGIHDEDYQAIRDGFDEYGYPAEPTPDVLKAAARESSYTAVPGPLADAGEAVDERTQNAITKQVHTNAGHQALVNQARREKHELELRLERACEDARLRGVDISSPLRVIERQLAKIERRVYDGKAA